MKNLTLFNNTPADILSKAPSQVVIGSLFLFYCTMSWTGYSPVHSADEARYLMFAQNLSEGYYSPTASINIWNGPGYPIVLLALVSWGKKAMILLNPLFMIAGIYLFFRTLLQLDYSKFMAILFSTILGLFPFMFDDLPLLMSECFSFFLVCSILFYSERFYQSNTLLNLIILSILLTLLALTKILFMYVLLAGVLLGFTLLFFRIPSGKDLAKVGTLSLLFFSPWLLYTYQLTDQAFYPSNAGGMSLYWMSNPVEQEYGDWHSLQLTRPWMEEEQWKMVFEEGIKENHHDFLKSIEPLGPIAKDLAFKEKAIQNIVTHPAKFTKNIIYNMGRLWFGVPFSYYPQKPFLLLRIFYMSFFFVFFVLSVLVRTYKGWWTFKNSNIATLFIIYLGLSSLLSAYPRMLDIVFPFIFLFILQTISTILNTQKDNNMLDSLDLDHLLREENITTPVLHPLAPDES